MHVHHSLGPIDHCSVMSSESQRKISWMMLGIPFLLAGPVQSVFPAPKFEDYSSSNASFVLTFEPTSNIQSFMPTTPLDILTEAMKRFIARTVLAVPDFEQDYEVNPLHLRLQPLDTFRFNPFDHSTSLDQDTDESYLLEIDLEVTITTATVFGAIRALETLAQLLQFGWLDDHGRPIFLIHKTPLSIKDSPTFVYRGLLIDTSRHYLPIPLLLANLDAMAMNKLNVLHWHMTDDQSWPFQSTHYPELSEQGAFHPKRIYSHSDILHVIQEAKLRGIRVIPEFDMPGHTDAVAISHPELMSHCPFAGDPMDPTNEDTWTFISNLYHEIGDLFQDHYVHLGGDEVQLDCWGNDTSIEAWMKLNHLDDVVDLFKIFEKRLLAVIEKLGKKAIVWQEVFDLGVPIANDTIVDVWKDWDGQEGSTIHQATSAGYPVILSACWYLDHLNERWQDYYQCDPIGFNLTLAQQELIIGGHASMWGEHVDPSNFMSRVWPRASAAAEKLWTGTDTKASATVSDRIHAFRCHMLRQGIQAGPTGPGYCDKEPGFQLHGASIEWNEIDLQLSMQRYV